MNGIAEAPGATVKTTSVTAPAAMPLSGAALRREQGRREMRAAILDEARRLLTEEGPGALSMRAIARALGYSPAALYEYFPAKEDIFAALYFEGAGGLAGRMVASGEAIPPGSSIHATLHEMGRAYRRYAHEQPELFGLVFGGKSMHGQSPGDADDERPGFDELVRAIERGIDAGEIDSPVAEPVAVACWSIVHGFVVLEMAGYFGPGETRVTADPEPDDTLEPSHYSGQQPTPDGLFELVLDRMLLGVVRRRG